MPADQPDDELASRLSKVGGRWLVTGAAGFIGSNLVESLLAAGQRVVGLDNFATGHRSNLEEVRATLGEDKWSRFELIEADIRDRDACVRAVNDVEFVLHQAALGSVPRSLADPLTSHDVNVTGLVKSSTRRGWPASDASSTRPLARPTAMSPIFPSARTVSATRCRPTPRPSSPTKSTRRSMRAATISRQSALRYFNVFGPKQDPDGPYAAVLPKWIAAMLDGQPLEIFGDGSTSRDFCYVANAVQANLRAALAPDEAQDQVYNVAVGERTTLNQLFGLLRDGLKRHQVHYDKEPVYTDFRRGDVRHSEADISKARRLLGYEPTHRIGDGIAEALPWYLRTVRQASP